MTLKGKTTRRNRSAAKDDHAEIPRWLIEENRDIELCIDGMELFSLALILLLDSGKPPVSNQSTMTNTTKPLIKPSE